VASPPTGFQALHPDRNLNFQLNRALFEGRLEDLRRVAPRIHDYADWKRELLAIAQAAAREERLENAFAYYRAAEFFMSLDDPDRGPTCERFRALFDRAHPDLERRLVPYRAGALPAFELPARGAERGVLVLHAGFDAFIEELYPLAQAFADAGQRVVAFDGPGQGSAIERHGLTMEPAWERPVAAVLDHFRLDGVTLVGVSLGGCLAIRAAAREPRVSRVVAFDVLTDFYDCFTAGKGPLVAGALRALVRARMAPFVNLGARFAMRRDLLSAWAIPRAMYLTGTGTPYRMLQALRQLTTRDCSALVRQDVLVLAGADDHMVPLGQYYDQLRWLEGARSVTGRLFSREEGAAEHCQFGNVQLAVATILRWIDEHDRGAP
jgi:pimeloyl-ACP methyl ester carboxylesterase